MISITEILERVLATDKPRNPKLQDLLNSQDEVDVDKCLSHCKYSLDYVEVIQALEKERDKLYIQKEDADYHCHKAEEQLSTIEDKLEVAADIMVERGLVHNTPAAKYEWMYS